MPQFDLTVFSSQIFWLVIFFAALMTYTVRVSVPRMRDVLDERWQRTDGFKISAERFQGEALELKKNSDQVIADAKLNAQTMMSSKSAEMTKEHDGHKKDVYAAYLKSVGTAESRIKKVLDDSVQEIKLETTDIASKVIDRVLALETNQDDIKKSVNDNMKVTIANGT